MPDSSENAVSWFQRALRLDRDGKYEEGLYCYDMSLATDPNFAEAWSNKGKTLGSLKRYTEAMEALKKSIELEPTAIAWSNLANALMETGNYKEAICCYDKSLALDTSFAGA